MLACYDGMGSRYIKHCDNPNKNGRVLTAIMYLNQNWKQEAGGQLRIFPGLSRKEVIDVDPIFNRLLVFYSDTRTPHEVLPSFSRRFAVTTWYFDERERRTALLQSQDEEMAERHRIEDEIKKFHGESMRMVACRDVDFSSVIDGTAVNADDLD